MKRCILLKKYKDLKPGQSILLNESQAIELQFQKIVMSDKEFINYKNKMMSYGEIQTK